MKILLFIIIFLSVFLNLNSKENSQDKDVRTFINLLDYLGSDYRNAVSNGEIISKDEYNEMYEFINSSISLFENINQNNKLSNREIIRKNLLNLKEMISAKKDKDSIFVLSNLIKSEILKLNLISVTPPIWSDISKGKEVFQNNCTSCHGNKGDGNGELIKNLVPKPANFLDETLMNSVSPLQIYNTIRLGISGTAMKPFNLLSDEEVWDAAFYVSSLRYKNKNNFSDAELDKYFKQALQNITLEDAALLSDKLLTGKFSTENEKYLASVRLHQASENVNNVKIDIAVTYLEESFEYYKVQNFKMASDMALYAYLQGIEPFEKQLESIDGKIKGDLESIMFKIRSDIKARKSISIIEKDIREAKLIIKDASSLLEDNKFTFWFAFLMAATIILREGVEAFLIIIVILGVLKSINADKARIWVHGGWITALILGILSMLFINLIISFGAQSRELLEGIGSITAVILLLYIGFWLHSKTTAKKWKEFIENKILKLVDAKNMLGLAFVSFIAVFREAFESAIFLSSVNIDVSSAGKTGMYVGAITSLIVVLIMSRIALIYASKLPIRQLFKYSAFVMIFLAVVIAGKGIRAFQESGFTSVTNLSGLERIDLSLLGIFPTIETLAAQIAVISLGILLWFYSKRTPKLSGGV